MAAVISCLLLLAFACPNSTSLVFRDLSLDITFGKPLLHCLRDLWRLSALKCVAVCVVQTQLSFVSISQSQTDTKHSIRLLEIIWAGKEPMASLGVVCLLVSYQNFFESLVHLFIFILLMFCFPFFPVGPLRIYYVKCFYRIPKCANEWVSASLFLVPFIELLSFCLFCSIQMC